MKKKKKTKLKWDTPIKSKKIFQKSKQATLVVDLG